ncbi:MAG: hypothetical protein GF355_14765 [Candidatus Eisenbacteria bacterium]|nr:hypothetical protein [Candidatus Eisenbacteria bacterium]
MTAWMLTTAGQLAAAAPPPEAELATTGGLVGRVALSLALVLGLLLALVFAYRRLQRRSPQKGGGDGIDVAAHKAVGRQAHVALLSIGSRRVLVGVTPQRITRLGSWSERPARTPPDPDGFGEALEERLQRLRHLVPHEETAALASRADEEPR